jgi:hypothetical protein
VSGLTNGTAYTFTVRATNSVGTGTASAASNSVTPVAATLTTPPKVEASFMPMLPTSEPLQIYTTMLLVVKLTNQSTGWMGMRVDNIFTAPMVLGAPNYTMFTPANCGFITSTSDGTSQWREKNVRFSTIAIAPGASCEAKIQVLGSIEGTITNTTNAPVGTIPSTAAGSPASASVTFLWSPLLVGHAFYSPPIPPNSQPMSINEGDTINLRLMLYKGSPNPKTDIGLSVTLPFGLRFNSATPAVTVTPGSGAVCSGPATASYDMSTRVLNVSGIDSTGGGFTDCNVDVAGLTNEEIVAGPCQQKELSLARANFSATNAVVNDLPTYCLTIKPRLTPATASGAPTSALPPQATLRPVSAPVDKL